MRCSARYIYYIVRYSLKEIPENTFSSHFPQGIKEKGLVSQTYDRGKRSGRLSRDMPGEGFKNKGANSEYSTCFENVIAMARSWGCCERERSCWESIYHFCRVKYLLDRYGMYHVHLCQGNQTPHIESHWAERSLRTIPIIPNSDKDSRKGSILQNREHRNSQLWC